MHKRSIKFSRLKSLILVWHLLDFLTASLVPIAKASALVAHEGFRVKKDLWRIILSLVVLSILSLNIETFIYLMRINVMLLFIVLLYNSMSNFSLQKLYGINRFMSIALFISLLLGLRFNVSLYGGETDFQGGSRGMVESGNQLFWSAFFIYFANTFSDKRLTIRCSSATLVSIISFLLIQTKLSILMFIIACVKVFKWLLLPIAILCYLFLDLDKYKSFVMNFESLRLLSWKLANESFLSAVTNNRFDKWLNFKLHIFPSGSYFNFESTILNLLSNGGLFYTVIVAVLLRKILRNNSKITSFGILVLLFSSMGGHLEESVIAVFGIVSIMLIFNINNGAKFKQNS